MLSKKATLSLILLIIVISLLLTSCYTNMNINANGIPLPNHITRLSNPETSIEATVSFVRQFVYTEGDESVVMPEYLPLSVNHKIYPSKTKALTIAVHVYNPKRVKYSMWEVHKFWYADSRWPTNISRCFYQGMMSTKDFRIDLPLDNVIRAESKVELRDSDGKTVTMSFGNATYELINN